MAEKLQYQVPISHKMQSPVPENVENKLVSDKNTLLAVLQLLRKYNLKVEYILLGREAHMKLVKKSMTVPTGKSSYPCE
jgi:hypothetical protein